MFTIKSIATFVAAIVLITMSNAQRSPYAGNRPSGYSDKYKPQETGSTTEEVLINRFGDDNSGTQRPPVQGVQIVEGTPNFAPIQPQLIPTNSNNPTIFNQNTGQNGLNNRVDLDQNNGNVMIGIQTPLLPNQSQNIPPTSTDRLPYDAYNDHYLVDNANRNPLDHRPFWLINAQHIERHRNQTSNQVGNYNPAAPQSTFQG